jgi:hypothetical protein
VRRLAHEAAPGPGGGEAGQVLVLGGLALGLLLAPLCLGVLAAALALGARAALGRAAAAAALAAAGTERVATLEVRITFTDYACSAAPGAAAQCRGTPGSALVALTPAAGADGPGGPFGPVPGWAAAAGCAGTTWTGTAPAGDWRICTGQAPVGATLAPPDESAMAAAAAAWLRLNAQDDATLRAAHVVAVTPGPDGAVTVVAAARTALPGPFGRVRASAEAWPAPA